MGSGPQAALGGRQWALQDIGTSAPEPNLLGKQARPSLGGGHRQRGTVWPQGAWEGHLGATMTSPLQAPDTHWSVKAKPSRAIPSLPGPEAEVLRLGQQPGRGRWMGTTP